MKKQDIMTLWASYWIPRDDVFLIVQKVMRVSSKDLFLLDTIDVKHICEIERIFSERKSWTPLEYILWESEFYGHVFFVNKHTLIPKNDTEVLVEKAIDYISTQNKKITLIDIWTGTWCIAISVLKSSSDSISNAYAIDVSSNTLEVTRKNIYSHWFENKIEAVEWSLFTPLQDKDFDHLVVTANLPYVKNDDFENIDSQVIDYEPHLALFGWKKTGFELYEKLISQLQQVQAESIILFIEIGFDQWGVVRDFCNKQKINFKIYTDNAWVERCVEMKIV